MANTPPRPSIGNRSNEELLEDLCIALRNVACNDYELPNGERVAQYVYEVRAIHAELMTRRVDWVQRLERLSQETRWQIPQLLEDCLSYPQRLPYVRDLDGIRRTLRCTLCAEGERPPDAKLFWSCNECMKRVLHALQSLSPSDGIILFRTYNSECRCAHADADTVLAVESSTDTIFGVCEKCVSAELVRRQSN
jgi:hypothetical protein